MIEAKAISRCEVNGTPYNPGDTMMLTEQQFEDLLKQGAATRVISRTMVQPPRPGATIPQPKKG